MSSTTTALMRSVLRARSVAPLRALSTTATTSALASGREGGLRAQRAARNAASSPLTAGGARDARTPGPSVPREGMVKLLKTLTDLKADNRIPTAAAYLTLMREAADYASRRGNNPGDSSLGFEIAMAAMRDADAGKVELGNEVIDLLLRFAFIHPHILPSLLLQMPKTGPTPTAFNQVAALAYQNNNLDHLVATLVEMLEHDIVPSKNAVKQFVRLCCEWGQPRLALEFVERLEKMPGASRVEAASFVQILAASADCQYLAGVVAGWERVVATNAYTPDEGLLLGVLAVAGRWGNTALATAALEILPKLGVEAQEHHMAPLLEALCAEGRVPDALRLVASFRQSGIAPTLSTVQPITAVLEDIEVVDQAFYTLEDMHKEGETVDVCALNAIIDASVKLGDLQRARATQLAAADLGVKPNIDTFNLVLKGCAKMRYSELGDTVMSEMSAAGVSPNGDTYNSLIRICLSQPEYDNAFYYLETMKAEGYKPSAALYSAIGDKCVRNEDDRYKLVAEEMVALGYPPSDFERRLTDRRGGSRSDGNWNNRRGNDNRGARNRRQWQDKE